LNAEENGSILNKLEKKHNNTETQQTPIYGESRKLNVNEKANIFKIQIN